MSHFSFTLNIYVHSACHSALPVHLIKSHIWDKTTTRTCWRLLSSERVGGKAPAMTNFGRYNFLVSHYDVHSANQPAFYYNHLHMCHQSTRSWNPAERSEFFFLHAVVQIVLLTPHHSRLVRSLYGCWTLTHSPWNRKSICSSRGSLRVGVSLIRVIVFGSFVSWWNNANNLP